MTKEEIKDYLSKHLSIDIESVESDLNEEEHNIRLKLEGETISHDWFYAAKPEE